MNSGIASAINQAGCRAKGYLCETEQKKKTVPMTERDWNIKEIFSLFSEKV